MRANYRRPWADSVIATWAALDRGWRAIAVAGLVTATVLFGVLIPW